MLACADTFKSSNELFDEMMSPSCLILLSLVLVSLLRIRLYHVFMKSFIIRVGELSYFMTPM